MMSWKMGVAIVVVTALVTLMVTSGHECDNPCAEVGFEQTVVVDDEVYCYPVTCGEDCVMGMIALREVSQ